MLPTRVLKQDFFKKWIIRDRSKMTNKRTIPQAVFSRHYLRLYIVQILWLGFMLTVLIVFIYLEVKNKDI